MGQAAARRGAEFRLYPQAVEQRAVPHRAVTDGAAQRLWPVGIGSQAQVMQILHADDERG
ncbi:hypothetical protein GGER_43930 [Serratia rubidaea]